MKKHKTLHEKYLDNTTFKERNRNPVIEGIVETLSNCVEHEGSFTQLPKALDKLQEFHLMMVGRNKLDKVEDHEKVATTMTLLYSLMLFEKHIAHGMKRIKEGEENAIS